MSLVDGELDDVSLDDVELDDVELDDVELDDVELDDVSLDDVELDDVSLDVVGGTVEPEVVGGGVGDTEGIPEGFMVANLQKINNNYVQKDI